MIPITDSPRDPAYRPWATLGLILANVLIGVVTLPLVFFAWTPEAALPEPLSRTPGQLHQLNWVLFTFGFRPSQASLLTTLSAMFLHGGVLHLAGNMLYLWIYGPNVERRLGRGAFVSLYFTTGVLGTLLYAIMSIGSPVPMVGASGAISGILGAYLIFFPINSIHFLLYVTTVRVPAWLVLLFYVVLDNAIPFILNSASSTAHAAHLGGFFAGAVLATCLRFLQPKGAADRRPRADPLAHPLQLIRQGMLLDAHQALTSLTASAKPEIADAARRHIEQLEANSTFQRASRRGH